MFSAPRDGPGRRAAAYPPPWQPSRLLTSRCSKPSSSDLSSGEKASGRSTFWGEMRARFQRRVHAKGTSAPNQTERPFLGKGRRSKSQIHHQLVSPLKRHQTGSNHLQSQSKENQNVSSLLCTSFSLLFDCSGFALDFLYLFFSYRLLANLHFCPTTYSH